MLFRLKKNCVATLLFSTSCVDSCNHCTVLLEPFNLQQGFTSNSELHIRRLFKKYNKNLHKSDLRRVSTLYTFYSIMLISEETRSAAANMFQLRNNGLEFFFISLK